MASALTVLEPWASGIIHGTKRIENRSWRTHHRGPLVIHAGLGRKFLKGADASDPMIQQLLPGLASLDDLPYGLIVGMVDVVDCVKVEDLPPETPWASGPWCWVLANPRPLKPVPFKGKLMIFTIPDELLGETISEVGAR